MAVYRREVAYETRVSAAQLAKDRPHPEHLANGDEQRWASANYAMCFTKGLPHEGTTGLIRDPRDFEAFRRAIDEGFIDRFNLNVPVAREVIDATTNPVTLRRRRDWEAPTAGIVGDLQGPDAQAVTMAPAPKLGSAELAYEMAEVYELAILRDVEFTEFSANGTGTEVQESVDRLNAITYALDGSQGRPRLTDEAGVLTRQQAYRGSTPGVDVGPYLSQFLLIGNDDLRGQPGQTPPGAPDDQQVSVADGFVQYGAQRIDQRVPIAPGGPNNNYMISRATWLDVQNGFDVFDGADLHQNNTRRFITTPRDLATYVHFDALYQAYLNACLILLGMRTPFDPGFAQLSGGRDVFIRRPNETHGDVDAQAGGFALYGGPHILSLVTEVATRALKAVRFQKFNNHIRLRPEALAGRIEFASEIEAQFPNAGAAFEQLESEIQDSVNAVEALNPTNTKLLPMAFQEGSPMHPAYGAGHATVAGACVTILKAFFDTNTQFVRRAGGGGTVDSFARREAGDQPLAYNPDATGANLVADTSGEFLTLEGELNKLAANISIGRNMAGVHYFSDYYDSLRMGEEIAIGLLEEQALCYPTDPFVLTVPTFDGDVRRIGAR